MDLGEYTELLNKVHDIGENSSIEEINEALKEAEFVKEDMNNLQLAVKIMINGMYGATAAPYFIGYNPELSEAITLQGQDVIHFASQAMEDYFQKLWPVDKKMHKLLGVKTPGKVEDKVTVYGDTDSGDKSMVINSNYGNHTVEELFEKSISTADSFFVTAKGTEILKPNNLSISNYTNDGNIELSKVRFLIRHKIDKPKYKIKTKSGKEIMVSCDHSCIVFRNGEKIKVKPEEILKTDKILITNP